MPKHITIKYIFAIASFLFIQSINAQDLHFSQYINAPLLVNPANTGFNPDFDYRIGGNYRNQWSSVTNNPYKTMSIWTDAQLFNNRFENAWVGVGASLLQDVAGAGNLTSTKGYASVAYHQLLDDNNLISGGFNLGFTQKRIDLNKLTFNSQWNGRFFDIAVPSNEPFVYNSVTYFTLQAGMNYAHFGNKFYYNIGASVTNINRPNESFFSNYNANTLLERRLTVFANASFKMQDVWIFNPNIYYSRMSTANEIVVGGMVQRDLSLENNGSTQLLAGCYYRVEDAIIPMIGFTLGNTSFTFNYDATTSSLKSTNKTLGAYEISIVKNGLYKAGEKNIKCPTMRY
mgnify:CR=1 FL=1